MMERFYRFRAFFAIAPLLIANGAHTRSFPPEEADRPLNVLFISIDDLRNDLGALGVAHARTPNLDALAGEGRLFGRHYAQAPTCGASRAALLRGKRPDDVAYLRNTAIADTHDDWGQRSLPVWFRQHGYQTLSLGKVSHFPGGLTGDSWAEGLRELPGAWDRAWVPDGPWRTPQDMMHGYADGQPREAGVSPAWQAHDGSDRSYPDAWVAQEAIDVLQGLSDSDEPWFFAVGFFKPHLPFAAPREYFDLHDPANIPGPEDTDRHPPPSSWHGSAEMMNNYGHVSDPRSDEAYARRLRHGYAAATSYVDAQVGRLLEALGDLDLNERTIVVVWSDHGFALGEQGIWGKHSLYEDALRSPLIIRTPGLGAPGEVSDAVVETVDLFPTLTDLTGVPTPGGLHGNSLRDQLRDAKASSNKPAYGHWRGQTTVRNDEWRLIVHRSDGEIEGFELFDFREDPEGRRRSPEHHPAVVEELLEQLQADVVAVDAGA